MPVVTILESFSYSFYHVFNSFHANCILYHFMESVTEYKVKTEIIHSLQNRSETSFENCFSYWIYTKHT